MPEAHLDLLSCQEIPDFVATEIAKFVSAHPENEDGSFTKRKKLGFTLSFPVDKALPFTGTTFQRKSSDDPVEFLSSSCCFNVPIYIYI